MLPDFFKGNIILLDGAMGTVLQQKGLPPGGQPELLNLTDPELLVSVYQDYIEAGSQVIYTNTFGANGLPGPELRSPWTSAPWGSCWSPSGPFPSSGPMRFSGKWRRPEPGRTWPSSRP